VSTVGSDARKSPFIVRVSSPPPSQSKPCQLKVYWEGGLTLIVVEAVAVFAFASVTVTLTVYVPGEL